MSEKHPIAPAITEAAPPVSRSPRRPLDNVLLTEILTGLALAAPLTLGLSLAYGAAQWLRFLVGLSAALLVQGTFLRLMRRRIGPEKSTPADALTLLRACAAGVLAGLVVAGIHDRVGLAGWLACVLALIAATVCDWVDGPLARRFGPTRLGGVLDIEADSWLTLWCAAGAVAWGGLPWWVLLPPLVRYAFPIRALLRGDLPAGGGPWWGRVTGVAQMALLLAALTPVEAPWRDTALTVAAIPISAAQMVAITTLLLRSEH